MIPQNYLSKSRLDLIHKSPYLYWWKYLSGQYVQPEPTAALTMGKALHCRVLEPEHYGQRYAILPPNIDRRIKEGKELYNYFINSLRGHEILTKEQDAQIENMHRALMAHSYAGHLLLSEGEREKELLWESDGVNYKGIADLITNSGFIVDLKTTDDASPSAFAYSVKKYRYHVQAAMYCDAFPECQAFIFIAIEKTPPYMVGVYYINEMDIQRGREEYLQDVELWKACNEANNWPQFSGEIMELNLKL